MTPLTPRQQQVLDYIRQRIADGLPPTVREIGAEFGISSPNGVRCHLNRLEELGYITRGSRSREVWVVGMPTYRELLEFYEETAWTTK